MPKIYNVDDLIRFIYSETTVEENEGISQELTQNILFREAFEQLKTTVDSLDECSLNPHPTSVNLIMEYAQKLHEPAH